MESLYQLPRHGLDVPFFIENLAMCIAWAILIAPRSRQKKRIVSVVLNIAVLFVLFFGVRFALGFLPRHRYLLAWILGQGVLTAILFFAVKSNRTKVGIGVWCSMYAGSLCLVSIGGQFSMVEGAFLLPDAVQGGTRILFALSTVPLALYLQNNRLDEFSNIPGGGFFMVVSGDICLLIIRSMEAFWFSEEYRQKLFFAVAYLCVFTLVMCSVYAVNNICQERVRVMRLTAEKQRLLSEKEMIQFSERQLEDLRILRHEIKNQYAFMRILLEERRYDELIEYFDANTAKLNGALTTVDCGNHSVNVILNMERQKAAAMGIPLQLDLTVPKELPISDDDLCSVLANMIDNALEECERLQKSTEKEDAGVEVSILPRNAYLYIQVKNPTDRTRLDKRPNGLRTTKSDDQLHGYGTQIIHRVAEHYNGCAVFAIENGFFTAKVLLELFGQGEVIGA